MVQIIVEDAIHHFLQIVSNVTQHNVLLVLMALCLILVVLNVYLVTVLLIVKLATIPVV